MLPPEEETYIGTAYQESETDSHTAAAQQGEGLNSNSLPPPVGSGNQEAETRHQTAPTQRGDEPGTSQYFENSDEEEQAAEPETPQDNSETETEEDDFDQAVSANPQEDSADDTP